MSKAIIDVTLNNEEAKARLKEIAAELTKVKNLREQALEKGHASAFDLANKEMKKLQAESKKLSKEVFDVNNVLKNISSASIKDLNTAIRTLSRDLDKMKRTDPGYGEKQKALENLREEYNRATGKAKEHTGVLGRMGISFGSAMSIVGQFAAGLGIATGAVAAIKGVIASTDTVSDRFNKTVGGLTSGLSYLGRAIATMDFSNFLSNMRSAIEEGQRYVDTVDMIGDKTRALTIIESQNRAEIAKNKITARDVTLPYDERLKAANKVLDLEQKNADYRKEIADDVLQNELDSAKDITKLSGERIEGLLKEKLINKDNVALANQYLDALNEQKRVEKQSASKVVGAPYYVQAGAGTALSEKSAKILRETPEDIKKYAQELKQFGKIAEDTSKDSETSLNKLTKAFEGVGEAQAYYDETTSRTQKNRSTIIKEMLKDEASREKTIKNQDTAYENLNKQIQELEKTLADQVFRNDPKSAQTLKLLELAKAKAEEVKEILDSYNAAADIKISEKPDQYFTAGFDDEINAIIDKNDLETKLLDKKLDDQQKIYEDALKDKEKADKDYQAKKEDMEKLAIDTSISLLNTAADLIYEKDMQAIEDKYSEEEARLEKMLNNNSISQQSYENKVKLLREKRAKEEEKIEKQTSAIKKTIAAIGITADAAESVFKIKAMAAELTAKAAVLAITNPAAAALYPPLIATVLAQIPLILGSAALQIAAAMASGGKKAGGFAATDKSDDTPMGYYHANEFIGNADSVRNPSVRKIYDVIDYAQRNGTISNINLPAIISASFPGRESGGYTGLDDDLNTLSDAKTKAWMAPGVYYAVIGDVLKEVALVVKDLKTRLDSPIEASVALRGSKGLYEAMDEDNQLKNNASL